MRKLIILAVTAAPAALFASGVLAQSSAPMPQTGAPPAAGGAGGMQGGAQGGSTGGTMGGPAAAPSATPDQPDATGGQLADSPKATETQPPASAQSNSSAQAAPDKPAAGQTAQGTAGSQPGAQPSQNAQQNAPAPNSQSTAQGSASGTQNASSGTQSAKAATNVNITAEKQTTIKRTITSTDVEPVRNVNFTVNVGVAVPRTIELHPLPPRVVEIVPQYRNYRYFVLADGRIVIVEPGTYHIVYVIV